MEWMLDILIRINFWRVWNVIPFSNPSLNCSIGILSFNWTSWFKKRKHVFIVDHFVNNLFDVSVDCCWNGYGSFMVFIVLLNLGIVVNIFLLIP